MFHRWAALLLVLALCAISPKNAAGQSQTPRGQSAQGKLGKNYPNPFNPETFWQFAVGSDGCVDDAGRQYAVTLQIYNVLGQPIATAVLHGPGLSGAARIPGGSVSGPLRNLKLGCGSYEAYWSGKVDRGGTEAPSGTYLARFFIDGKPVDTHKIFISK